MSRYFGCRVFLPRYFQRYFGTAPVFELKDANPVQSILLLWYYIICPSKKSKNNCKSPEIFENEFVLEIYLFLAAACLFAFADLQKNSAAIGSMHFWHFQSAQCHGVARFTDD